MIDVLMKLLLSALLCLLVHQKINAQLNLTHLENNIVQHDSTTEALHLDIFYNSFFKNNEYFDSIANGYTLFGTQLQTSLAYVLHPNIRLQAGFYARKDFGNDGFHTIQPTFTIKLQKNGYGLLMGNLEGNIAHRLVEPLYNYERYMLQHTEQGLQLKINNPKLWSDTWLDWEVQQYAGSPFQEQFTFGHSSQINVFSNKKVQLHVPVQAVVSHRGGQIDIDTTSLQTIANMSTGFSVSLHAPTKWLQKITSENYFLIFKDASPTKKMPFASGTGLFLNVRAETIYQLSAVLSYWSGREFISTRGGDLFSSAATQYGARGYTEAKRDLLFLRLHYNKQLLDGFFADIRFEPYYNMQSTKLNYSYSLFLTYKRDVKLLSLTNGKRVKK
jgi:hypothetical protein